MIDTKKSEILSSLLNFIDDCEKFLGPTQDRIKYYEKYQNDIEHKIELDDSLKYHDYAKLAKELKEVRKNRRIAKDELDIIQPIVAYVEKNRGAINQLKQTLGEVRKVEKYQENRVYYNRVREEE